MTTGLYDRRWKAEVSVFNGREPDEGRADLDLGPLDSVSARVSFLPTDTLAFQVSAGHLNEAETGFPPEPPTDVNRATASVTYHRPLRQGGIWATTIALGVNSARERETASRAEFERARGAFASTVARLNAGADGNPPRAVGGYLEISASLLELNAQSRVSYQMLEERDSMLKQRSPAYNEEAERVGRLRATRS